MATPVAARKPDDYREGVSAVTLKDIRWGMCDIKAITLLANVLLRRQAADANAFEAILVRDGFAHEGAASNLFVVNRGVIVTPPKGPNLLPGITRDLILELVRGAGLPCEEATIPESALEKADEIWLSSSTKEIMPVTVLNGNPVGAGVPGPLWERVAGLYRDRAESFARGEA